jgi:peptidoglycan/LPS O-acetylase OafA/YrhL
MVSHFFPAYQYPITEWLALGATGVRLFFVLSGFLITGILLRGRDEIASGAARWGTLLGAFYARRFLRIFPLFYAVVLVLYVLDHGYMREALFWHLTYLMNFWRVANDIHYLNHFWTLAVEEHFYLVWPLVVLGTPRRMLAPVMIAFIIAAQVYRLTLWTQGAGYTHLNIITFANLDTLALGGLLALYMEEPARYPGRAARLAWGGMLTGSVVTLMLAVAVATGFISDTERTVVLSLALGLLFCGVIALGARDALPGARWWLTPLAYVGKISYGLYVLHPLVWQGLTYLETHARVPLPEVWWLRMPLFFAAALAAAALAWHLYELPLNRLKRHFPYVRR